MKIVFKFIVPFLSFLSFLDTYSSFRIFLPLPFIFSLYFTFTLILKFFDIFGFSIYSTFGSPSCTTTLYKLQHTSHKRSIRIIISIFLWLVTKVVNLIVITREEFLLEGTIKSIHGLAYFKYLWKRQLLKISWLRSAILKEKEWHISILIFF